MGLLAFALCLLASGAFVGIAVAFAQSNLLVIVAWILIGLALFAAAHVSMRIHMRRTNQPVFPLSRRAVKILAYSMMPIILVAWVLCGLLARDWLPLIPWASLFWTVMVVEPEIYLRKKNIRRSRVQ